MASQNTDNNSNEQQACKTEFIKTSDKLGEGGFGRVYLGYEQYISEDHTQTSPTQIIRKEKVEEENLRKKGLQKKFIQLVAIKVISKEKLRKTLENDPKRIEKAQELQRQEIDTLKSFHHENVISLLYGKETQKEFILVLEYCDYSFSHYLNSIRKKKQKNELFASMSSSVTSAGSTIGTSQQNLNAKNYKTNKKEPFLSEDEIRYWMLQFAKGVRAFAKHCFAHRDLKAENLMIKYSPRRGKNASNFEEETEERNNFLNSIGNSYEGPDVKLENWRLIIIDFGFSKKIEENQLAKTQCGTQFYMSPEVLRGDKYRANSDLWSVGVIMYQMLTGTLPFRQKNVIKAHEAFDSDKLMNFLSKFDVSEACRNLLVGLMQKDPNKRITFEDFWTHPFFSEGDTLGVSMIKSVINHNNQKDSNSNKKSSKVDNKVKQSKNDSDSESDSESDAEDDDDNHERHRHSKHRHDEDSESDPESDSEDETSKMDKNILKDVVFVDDFIEKDEIVVPDPNNNAPFPDPQNLGVTLTAKFSLWRGVTKTLKFGEPGKYLLRLTHSGKQPLYMKIYTSKPVIGNQNEEEEEIKAENDKKHEEEGISTNYNILGPVLERELFETEDFLPNSVISQVIEVTDKTLDVHVVLEGTEMTWLQTLFLSLFFWKSKVKFSINFSKVK